MSCPGPLIFCPRCHCAQISLSPAVLGWVPEGDLTGCGKTLQPHRGLPGLLCFWGRAATRAPRLLPLHPGGQAPSLGLYLRDRAEGMTVLPCSALSEGQQRKWETQRAQQEGWETAIQCCPGHTLPPVGRAELWEVPIGTLGADTERASWWGCDSVMGEAEPRSVGTV